MSKENSISFHIFKDRDLRILVTHITKARLLCLFLYTYLIVNFFCQHKWTYCYGNSTDTRTLSVFKINVLKMCSEMILNITLIIKTALLYRRAVNIKVVWVEQTTLTYRVTFLCQMLYHQQFWNNWFFSMIIYFS